MSGSEIVRLKAELAEARQAIYWTGEAYRFVLGLIGGKPGRLWASRRRELNRQLARIDRLLDHKGVKL